MKITTLIPPLVKTLYNNLMNLLKFGSDLEVNLFPKLPLVDATAG